MLPDSTATRDSKCLDWRWSSADSPQILAHNDTHISRCLGSADGLWTTSWATRVV